jgi:hypothetical protein
MIFGMWVHDHKAVCCIMCCIMTFMGPWRLTLERQKCYGPDKKILFKKPLFDLEVKGQGPTKVITVHDTLPYGHAPTYEISLTYLERQKSYGPDKLRWEEAGRKNQTKTICLPPFIYVLVELFVLVSVVHVYVLNIGFYDYGLRKISREWWPEYYVSPSNGGRHIVLVWFFLPASSQQSLSGP